MERFSWDQVEELTSQTVDIWTSELPPTPLGLRHYAAQEQEQRERAYDAALDAVERELSSGSGDQEVLVELFARFSASALDLAPDIIETLVHEFLPVGVDLARSARAFDPGLPMADIIQACRNAWTACGMQPLLGIPVHLTPSILAYSLLYPYSDNYLDDRRLGLDAKLQFSSRFRHLLEGQPIPCAHDHEVTLKRLVQCIEGEFPRTAYPGVYDSLLAIHRAQEHSIAQSTRNNLNDRELLRLSCAKGGSSVVADACLCRGRLTEGETRFAFEWGVLLQLGDDLQDVNQDLRTGSTTLFSSAAASGVRLDQLVVRLLHFSDIVGARMDALSHGSRALKDLLKMSWRSLIIRAVADSHEYFTPQFLCEAETCSPFRFQFLRDRQQRMIADQGLQARLFERFLAAF